MLEIADKVIAGIKTVRDIAKRIENAELLGQIADLMMASADLKVEMVKLKADALRLHEENAALRRKADIRAKMKMVGNMCYLSEPIPGYNSGPFCPICLEKDGLLMNVTRHSVGWTCPHCKSRGT